MGKRREESDTSVANNKKAKKSSNDEKTKEMDGRILKVMLEFHTLKRSNIKVGDVANALGVHIRTNSFRDRWSVLKNKKNFIGPGKDGGLQLTSEGITEAETPEYKEMMKELAIVPKTNKEHQDRIKKYLKKSKCGVIFDLLLEYKSLKRNELSDLVGINNRSHQFSDSLKELRAKDYVEKKPGSNKFYLSDKCFLNGKENRSKGEDTIDTKKFATKIAEGRSKIESRKHGPKKNIKIEVKKEEMTKNWKMAKDEIKKVKKETAMKEENSIDDVIQTKLLTEEGKSSGSESSASNTKHVIGGLTYQSDLEF